MKNCLKQMLMFAKTTYAKNLTNYLSAAVLFSKMLANFTGAMAGVHNTLHTYIYFQKEIDFKLMFYGALF